MVHVDKSHSSLKYVQYAATELQSALATWTADIPIVSPSFAKNNGRNFLAVGYGAAAALTKGDNLGDEGYTIKSTTSGVAITGDEGAPRGTIYGTYAFLRELGFEWFAADEFFAPPTSSCPDTLPDFDVIFVPAYEYRDNNQFQLSNNEDFAVRIGNNRGDFDAVHGGTVKYAEPPGELLASRKA